MPGDVSVEQDQDDQGDEEEDRDHEDEVELGPKILDLGLADGRVRSTRSWPSPGLSG